MAEDPQPGMNPETSTQPPAARFPLRNAIMAVAAVAGLGIGAYLIVNRLTQNSRHEDRDEDEPLKTLTPKVDFSKYPQLEPKKFGGAPTPPDKKDDDSRTEKKGD
jgi:hypothetical protein